jgi:hypothetical protein
MSDLHFFDAETVYSLSTDCKMKISNACLESYPCQHYVQVNDEPYARMDGRAIVEKFVNAGQPIPKHFHYLTKKNNKHKR